MTQKLTPTEYYTEEEIANFMGITVNTLRNRICAGRMHPPFVRVGRVKRFSKADFDRWVKNDCQRVESVA